MSAIGPGDWVECVDVSPRNSVVYTGFLTLGGVYLVTRVGLPTRGRDGTITSGLQLHGQPRTGAFDEARFRPIYRPKADLIESLKAPAKREGVPA